MRTWKFLIIFIIIIVGCITYSMFSYYMPPTEHQPYFIPHQDDTLRIAYIGDSWAFMHREHNCIIPTLLKDALHRPVKIHSYGMCGQTSKEFYENIFSSADLKHFLLKRRYEYCFISLGINDTYKKMSTSYYQQSMDYIIRFFLINHTHPIILEIPDYNISRSFNRQVFSRKLLRRLSMYINNTPLDCKQLFRDALDEMILERNHTKEVSVVRYLSWNEKGTKDWKTIYQDDGIHLNEKGYDILDSCIAETCIEHYKKRVYEKN